jgi:hypothetical protein
MIDTVFHESKLNDTLIITKEKLKLKLHRIDYTDYVEAEREADTVVVEKKVAVERITIQQNSQSSIDLLGAENKYYFLFSVFCLAKTIISIILCFSIKFPKNKNTYNFQ